MRLFSVFYAWILCFVLKNINKEKNTTPLERGGSHSSKCWEFETFIVLMNNFILAK